MLDEKVIRKAGNPLIGPLRKLYSQMNAYERIAFRYWFEIDATQTDQFPSDTIAQYDSESRKTILAPVIGESTIDVVRFVLNTLAFEGPHFFPVVDIDTGRPLRCSRSTDDEPCQGRLEKDLKEPFDQEEEFDVESPHFPVRFVCSKCGAACRARYSTDGLGSVWETWDSVLPGL